MTQVQHFINILKITCGCVLDQTGQVERFQCESHAFEHKITLSLLNTQTHAYNISIIFLSVLFILAKFWVVYSIYWPKMLKTAKILIQILFSNIFYF